MTTVLRQCVGLPVERVDGRLKVTGGARYSAEVRLPGLTHAVSVSSTIGRGRIRRIETARALAAPGVLAVISHENADRLNLWDFTESNQPSTAAPRGSPPLQSNEVRFAGQHVAVVVAETLEQAHYAAELVEVAYDTQPPVIDFQSELANAFEPPAGDSSGAPADTARGDAKSALAAAPVQVDSTYRTQDTLNHPLGLFATTAIWEAGRLTVYDSTQDTVRCQRKLAQQFDLPVENVRVISPFVGGAFGASLTARDHVALAALAARQVRRPVRLVLSRPQMFTALGNRPRSLQRMRLGATRSGELTAIVHQAWEPNAVDNLFVEPIVRSTLSMYACPNVAVSYRLVRLNVGTPGAKRAPGEVPGMFALECAMDELASALGMDPIELRLRNFAELEVHEHKPWSTNALRECYRTGAERFGWSRRTPQPASMRDGDWLIGLGMASAVRPRLRLPASVTVTLRADASARVECSTHEIGPGTYTALSQVAADALGLPLESVEIRLGDTALPSAPAQGGSATLTSVAPVVHEACVAARAEAGRRPHAAEVHATATWRPDSAASDLVARAFGAHFVEVHVDPLLGLVRVARVVSVIDAGRIVNPRLAASQISGAIVGGIGETLMEEAPRDPRTGRFASLNFADYHVPVNSDIGSIEVEFVEVPDSSVPLGIKGGLGEIGVVGVAAAIANALHHATGRRFYELPITPDRVMQVSA
jgi:xanthine dehydrogenase YagR molybdenum-binding subunit